MGITGAGLLSSDAGSPGQTAPTDTFTARRHCEDGVWWAESDQLPGWTAVADDCDELWRLVSETPAVHLGWQPGTYTVVLLWADRLGPGLVA